jgi:ATP-dependent Lhr-like helicase
VAQVPPLSFAMYAAKIREALLEEDPFEVQERLFHHWWRQIEQTAEVGTRNTESTGA